MHHTTPSRRSADTTFKTESAVSGLRCDGVLLGCDGPLFFCGFLILLAKAAEVFHRLTKQSDAYAIIYVTETYAEALHAQIEKFASSVTPAVILIPGAGGCRGLGMNALNAAVERAVGSNIL